MFEHDSDIAASFDGGGGVGGGPENGPCNFPVAVCLGAAGLAPNSQMLHFCFQGSMCMRPLQDAQGQTGRDLASGHRPLAEKGCAISCLRDLHVQVKPHRTPVIVCQTQMHPKDRIYHGD